MSDFIREVDEDYRRERAANFLKRYQTPLAGLIILIVAGAGGWRWYVDRQAATAQNANLRYQAAETLASDGKAADAAAKFSALASESPAGYALLARIRAAEELGDTDAEAAAKQLDAIASDEGLKAPALRDLARFRGALLRVDRQDPKAFVAQYARFAVDGFTFHDSMRELLALASLKQGDAAAATKYLDDLSTDSLTPPALRNRAQAFRELVTAGPATATSARPGPASVKQIAGPPAPAGTPGGAPAPSAGEIAPVDTGSPQSKSPQAGPDAGPATSPKASVPTGAAPAPAAR